MSPRRNRRRAPRMPRPSGDDPAVDALYGLEAPIGAQSRDSHYSQESAGTQPGLLPVPLDCPYCGEPFETLVDLSAGSAAYIEDCPVCCQPIELVAELDAQGELVALGASRGD
jgi:cysteine-rich CPXCG protein